jgi:hypothetical protein
MVKILLDIARLTQVETEVKHRHPQHGQAAQRIDRVKAGAC